MRGDLDLDAILKMNPQVDAGALKESLALSDELKQAGLEAQGYRLASPADSHRIQVPDTKGQRRVVRLRSP